MSRYAAQTDVPADRSRAEIERTLQRYGAVSFMYGWEGRRALVSFRAHDRMIRFELPLPDREDPAFTVTPTGRQRSEPQVLKAWEQATRQAWRALALAIKAKLEVVEAEIATFEEEFLAHIVLPDGTTVGQRALPTVAEAYESGAMPQRLLPATLSGEEAR